MLIRNIYLGHIPSRSSIFASLASATKHIHDKRHNKETNNSNLINSIHALAIHLFRSNNPDNLPINKINDRPNILLHILFNNVHVVAEHDKHSTTVHNQAKYRVFNRGTLSFIVLCAIYVVLSRFTDFDTYTYFLLVVIIQAIVFL